MSGKKPPAKNVRQETSGKKNSGKKPPAKNLRQEYVRQEMSDKENKNRGFQKNRLGKNKKTSFEKPGKITRKKAIEDKKGVHYEWDESSNVSFGEIINEDDLLAVGQWVRHSSWGRGQIIAREGSGEKMKVTVKFGPHIKKIAVAFAQLDPG